MCVPCQQSVQTLKLHKSTAPVLLGLLLSTVFDESNVHATGTCDIALVTVAKIKYKAVMLHVQRLEHILQKHT